jgi:hypothetical protein
MTSLLLKTLRMLIDQGRPPAGASLQMLARTPEDGARIAMAWFGE